MDDVITLTSLPEPVVTDINGLVTLSHVANIHWKINGSMDHGEFTLCGKSINYRTHIGTAENAPDCPICKQLDC